MTPAQEMYDYIVHTLNAAQIVELCAMLLRVEADTLSLLGSKVREWAE